MFIEKCHDLIIKIAVIRAETENSKLSDVLGLILELFMAKLPETK